MTSFEEKLSRLKNSINIYRDKEISELLGLSQKAFSARKNRNAFPDSQLLALSMERPDLAIDVHYILTGTVADSSDVINRSIGDRLKAERKRLALTQLNAATLTHVQRETWSRYETGRLLPGTEVLASFADIGANIQYILTGKSSIMGEFSADQSILYLKKTGAMPGQTIARVQENMGWSKKADQQLNSDILARDEIELINCFRSAPLKVKMQVMQLLLPLDTE